jgi:hypothetical protein
MASKHAPEMVDRVRQRGARTLFVALFPEHADDLVSRGASLGAQRKPGEQR